MIALLIVLAMIGLAQLLLTYSMLREMGDIDKNRSDWWEKLEDRWEAAKRLKQAVQYQRGVPGPKEHDDKRL